MKTVFNAIVGWLKSINGYHSVIYKLDRLSDASLADIGLCRSDIYRIAEEHKAKIRNDYRGNVSASDRDYAEFSKEYAAQERNTMLIAARNPMMIA